MARAAQVILGNGSLIYWRDCTSAGVGTGAFVLIPSAKSIVLPAGDRDEIDVSDLDSENDYKEFQLGDKDPGESALVFHFNPSNAVHMDIENNAITGSDSLFEFKVTKTVSSTIYYKTWRGRLKNLEGGTVARNQPYEATLNIRNNGAPDAWTS